MKFNIAIIADSEEQKCELNPNHIPAETILGSLDVADNHAAHRQFRKLQKSGTYPAAAYVIDLT